MRKLYNKLQSIPSIFYSELSQRSINSESRMILFGIFGLIAFPSYFFINRYISSQFYSNLVMRIIASLLCLILILKNYWPNKIKPYLPVYWYVMLLYTLPFFFTFMFLMNHASAIWTMNIITIIFLLVLLVDTVSFSILLTVGSLLAWFLFSCVLNQEFTFISGNIRISDIVSEIITVIIMSVLFSRSKEKLELMKKLHAMRSIGFSIAHELRTPLRAISTGIDGLRLYLPKLLHGYKLAKEADLPVEKIRSTQEGVLDNVLDNIKIETDSAFFVIDMLLSIANHQYLESTKLAKCNMLDCVNSSISHYPMNAAQKKLFIVNPENNFIFLGNEVLISHLFYNLIRNALYFITKANKGVIHISFRHDEKANYVCFRDTGTGISAKILPKIFDRFFTTTLHGTGLGLAYCKLIMELHHGAIKCDSIENEFTEFTLKFPRDHS